MPFNNIRECGIYSSNELPLMTYTHRSSSSSSTYQATYISSQSQKHLSFFPIALDPDIANFICFSFQIFFPFLLQDPIALGHASSRIKNSFGFGCTTRSISIGSGCEQVWVLPPARPISVVSCPQQNPKQLWDSQTHVYWVWILPI